MTFGELSLDDALGAILAYSLKVDGTTFRKGRVLATEDITALRDAGFKSVVAVRLEAGDVDENTAAQRLASAIAGDNLKLSPTATGRCNLVATTAGLTCLVTDRIDALNLVNEAITVSTVLPFAPVTPGDMVATVKIITFGVPESAIEACESVARSDGTPIKIAAFTHKRIGLIQTRLPVLRDSLLEKAVRVTEKRLETIGSELTKDIRCDHQTTAIAQSFKTLIEGNIDIALVLGASAIADRRDVIPAAVEQCGGTVEHFGMPVDPGNLILLGRIGAMRVVGLPGSARSPRLHGVDWVLQRLVAGIDVTGRDLMRMGVGGLLKEIPGRPLPRISAVASAKPEAPPKIAGVILAAGQSRRMGPINKLLAEIDGKPMVMHAIEAVSAVTDSTVIVVTGHEENAVQAALQGTNVRFVYNPEYARGLSTSLKAGIEAIEGDYDGALVCLGDMPGIGPAHLERLIAAFAPDKEQEICVPTFNGKRGNPVLWHKNFFPAIKALSGDVGARHLIGENPNQVIEVPMDDDAILTDLDTPEVLADYIAKREQAD